LSFTIAAGPRQRLFSGQSPSGLMTTIYCLRFETPQSGGPGPHVPQEQGGPVIPPSTGFPFRRLLRLAGLRWRYSNQPPDGYLNYSRFSCTPYKPLYPDRVENTVSNDLLKIVVFSLPSNGRCLQSHLLATGVHTPQNIKK
jgi:hypothetical protein